MTVRETIHATTVSVDGRAIAIMGPSGSGKSDLALRLIDRGAILIADDYTDVTRDGDALTVSCPETIVGKIEVRGVGIVTMPHVQHVPLCLVLRLTDDVERLPQRAHMAIAGKPVRAIALDPFAASAPVKVELALREELP